MKALSCIKTFFFFFLVRQINQSLVYFNLLLFIVMKTKSPNGCSHREDPGTLELRGTR